MCPPPVATASDNQSFAKLSYRAIDNVLTNLLPPGLHDFFYLLNVWNVTMTVNKLLECSLDVIVYCLSLTGYSPSFCQLATYELMLCRHLLTDAFSCIHLVIYYVRDDVTVNTNYHRIVKCTFLSSYGIWLQVLKALIYEIFCKRSIN